MLSRILGLLIAKTLGQWLIRLLIGLGLAVTTEEGIKIHPVIAIPLSIVGIAVWIGLIYSALRAFIELLMLL